MIQIKTIKASQPYKLDAEVNRFLFSLKHSSVKDVKISTTYDQENFSTDYIAMVVFEQYSD